MSTTTMHFGPEWMRPRGQSQSQAHPPPATTPSASATATATRPPPARSPPLPSATSPAPHAPPPGASSYSSLVAPAPPEPQPPRDAANPFKYSKDDLLRVWNDGGGRGGLALEVERWEGVVREDGDEPVGLKDMSDAERKLFASPLNSELRRRQSSDVLPTTATNGDRPKLLHTNSGIGSPMRERFGNIMSRKREPGDQPPRKLSLGGGTPSRDVGLPSPRRLGSGSGPGGFEGILNTTGDSWLAKRRAMQRAESMGSEAVPGDTKDPEIKEEDEEVAIKHAPSPSPVPSTAGDATLSSAESDPGKRGDPAHLSANGTAEAAAAQNGPSGGPPGIKNLGEVEWTYLDPAGNVQGPFRSDTMQVWFDGGYFKHTPNLPMKRAAVDNEWTPIGVLVSQVHDPRKLFFDPSPPRPHAPPGLSALPPIGGFETAAPPNGHPEPAASPYQPITTRTQRGNTIDSYLTGSPIPGSPSAFGGASPFHQRASASPDLRNINVDYPLRTIGQPDPQGGYGGAAPGRPAYKDMLAQPAFSSHSPAFPGLPSARGSTFDAPSYPGNSGWQQAADLRQTPADASTPYGGSMGYGAAANGMDMNHFLATPFGGKPSPYHTIGGSTSSREGSVSGVGGIGAPGSHNISGFGAIGGGRQQSLGHQVHSPGLQQRYDAYGPAPGHPNATMHAAGGLTDSPQRIPAHAQPAPSPVPISPWGRINPAPPPPAPRRQDSLQPDVAPAPVSASLKQKQQPVQTAWVNNQTPDSPLPPSGSGGPATAWAAASMATLDDGWGEVRGPNSLTAENLKAHSEMHEKIAERAGKEAGAKPVGDLEVLVGDGLPAAVAAAALPVEPSAIPGLPTADIPSLTKTKRKGGASSAAPPAPQPVAIPAVPAVSKPPPSPIPQAARLVWGSGAAVDETKGGAPASMGLREIQDAEAKRTENRRAAEREREKARVAQGLTAGAGATPTEDVAAFTTSWGLPTSQAGTRTGAGAGKDSASPAVGGVAAPGTPGAVGAGAGASAAANSAQGAVWTNTGKAPSAKKTMKEIQEEEEKRKKQVGKEKDAAAVAPAKRGYADTATKNAAPSPAVGGVWTTVGANGKLGAPAAIAVATPARPASANAPSTASAAAAAGRPAVAATARPPSAISKMPSASSVKDEGPIAPSGDFMTWLRDSLRGLTTGVNFEDVAQMLLSFPLDPDPSTVEVIAETIYASSTTLDGRRFASEFIAKRKVDAQNRKPGATSTAGGKPASIADVVKAPKVAAGAEWGGFKVVHKKKKGARA